MIITINYNDDSVMIQSDSNNKGVVFNKLKDINKTKAILYETINLIANETNDGLNTTIQLINEDSQTVVGEW